MNASRASPAPTRTGPEPPPASHAASAASVETERGCAQNAPQTAIKRTTTATHAPPAHARSPEGPLRAKYARKTPGATQCRRVASTAPHGHPPLEGPAPWDAPASKGYTCSDPKLAWPAYNAQQASTHLGNPTCAPHAPQPHTMTACPWGRAFPAPLTTPRAEERLNALPAYHHKYQRTMEADARTALQDGYA